MRVCLLDSDLYDKCMALSVAARTCLYRVAQEGESGGSV